MFKRFGWISLVVGAVVGLLVAAIVTAMMPRQYESECVIEVRPLDHSPVAPPTRPEGETPAWLLTEIEKMKTRTTLEKVSDALQLTNRWNMAKDQVLESLSGTMLIQSIRHSDLVMIRVRHTNKEDARDIAHELAEVYAEVRRELAIRDTERQLLELGKAVRDQEDKVEERRKLLATIVRTKGIIHNGQLDLTSERLKRLQVANDPTGVQPIRRGGGPDYGDAKRDLEADQQLLEAMKLKRMGEEIMLKIPRDSVVIHDEPLVSNVPVSPNVTLNLFLGTGAGILLSPLLALPLIGLLNRSRA